MTTLDIPVDHPCFAGHFPNFPLVPGALLLAWIRPLVEQDCGLSLSHIKQAKFHQPVVPGQSLNIECRDLTPKPIIKVTVMDANNSAVMASIQYEHGLL